MAVSSHHPAPHYPTGNDAAKSAAIALLIHYFDLSPASAQLLTKKWLVNYSALWIRAAVTEALYQGRYKPFSVEQILSFWQRRGRAISHFNKEFETIIAVPLRGVLPNAAESAAVQSVALERAAEEPVAASNGQSASAPDALTAGLEMADQARSERHSLPLPRPRLMLPGELPGKELAEPFGTPAAQAHPKPSRDSGNAALLKPRSTTEAIASRQSARQSARQAGGSNSVPGTQSSAAHSAIEDTGAVSSARAIADPAARPVVTNEAAKPSQPISIGPFTPAADPSGLSSRLKTVVEQAIANQAANQTPREGDQSHAAEAQPSLRDAIATQIASDPFLAGASAAAASEPHSELHSESTIESPKSQPSPGVTEDPDLSAPSTTLNKVPSLAPGPELGNAGDADRDASAEVQPPPSSIAPSGESLSGTVPDSAIAKPALTPLADTSSPSGVSGPVLQDPPETESDLKPAADLEPAAAFEARFPLTHFQDSGTVPRAKDDLDLALDQAMEELSPVDHPDHCAGQSESSNPDVSNAHHDDEPAKLLDGEALSRHLDAGLEQDTTSAPAALEQTASGQTALGQTALGQTTSEQTTSEQAAALPASEEQTGQHAALSYPTEFNETALDISQVSGLVAGLSQQRDAQSDKAPQPDLAELNSPQPGHSQLDHSQPGHSQPDHR